MALNRTVSRPLSKPARFALTVAFSSFIATIWPVHSWFSHIRPMIFGVPFSLTYLIFLLLLVFFTMLGLYFWEDKNGEID